jgi:hypothetical protein
MERHGLLQRQKLILIVMALALIGVLVVLGVMLLEQDVPASPLSTLAVPTLRRATATPVVRPSATFTPVVSEPLPTPTRLTAPAEILAARRIQALTQDVGQIRELPKQQEIPFNFLGEREMASYLRRALTDAEHRALVQRQQTLLAALHLLPAPGQALPPSVRVRARQLVAFYDLDEAQIFVGPLGREGDPPDSSLVHQYAHALIDQHFSLSALVTGTLSSDVARARDALMEGDATAVMALHSFGSLDQADLDALAGHLSEVELGDYEGYPTSRAMREVYAFPYREGARFVAALLQAGWWPHVNAAYLDPPVSTEQILHPEKYVNAPRDEPRALSLPDLSASLDEGWQLLAQDVVGELILRAHLDQYLPSTPQAQAAAAGWDGDLVAVWRDTLAAEPDHQVLMIRTLWDSVSEASEFVRSYVELIDRRLRGASTVRRPGMPSRGRWWRGQGGDAYLQRVDDEVFIIWTPDTGTMEWVLTIFGEDSGEGESETGEGREEWEDWSVE